jgi:hypothetical protein
MCSFEGDFESFNIVECMTSIISVAEHEIRSALVGEPELDTVLYISGVINRVFCQASRCILPFYFSKDRFIKVSSNGAYEMYTDFLLRLHRNGKLRHVLKWSRLGIPYRDESYGKIVYTLLDVFGEDDNTAMLERRSDCVSRIMSISRDILIRYAQRSRELTFYPYQMEGIPMLLRLFSFSGRKYTVDASNPVHVRIILTYCDVAKTREKVYREYHSVGLEIQTQMESLVRRRWQITSIDEYSTYMSFRNRFSTEDVIDDVYGFICNEINKLSSVAKAEYAKLADFYNGITLEFEPTPICHGEFMDPEFKLSDMYTYPVLTPDMWLPSGGLGSGDESRLSPVYEAARVGPEHPSMAARPESGHSPGTREAEHSSGTGWVGTLRAEEAYFPEMELVHSPGASRVGSRHSPEAGRAGGLPSDDELFDEIYDWGSVTFEEYSLRRHSADLSDEVECKREEEPLPVHVIRDWDMLYAKRRYLEKVSSSCVPAWGMYKYLPVRPTVKRILEFISSEFSLEFKRRRGATLWRKHAMVWDVYDADRKHIGILYQDLFWQYRQPRTPDYICVQPRNERQVGCGIINLDVHSLYPYFSVNMLRRYAKAIGKFVFDMFNLSDLCFNDNYIHREVVSSIFTSNISMEQVCERETSADVVRDLEFEYNHIWHRLKDMTLAMFDAQICIEEMTESNRELLFRRVAAFCEGRYIPSGVYPHITEWGMDHEYAARFFTKIIQ